MGLPFRGIYSASKGALELITEAYRMELKPFGIQMTNVAPGDFATNIAAGRYHAPLQQNSPYYSTYGTSLKLMDDHVDDGKYLDPKELDNLLSEEPSPVDPSKDLRGIETWKTLKRLRMDILLQK